MFLGENFLAFDDDDDELLNQKKFQKQKWQLNENLGNLTDG